MWKAEALGIAMLMALSCHRALAPANVPPRRPTTVTATPAVPEVERFAAFSLITADGTLIVPVDPARELDLQAGFVVAGAKGVWIHREIITEASAEQAVHLPYCVNAEALGACAIGPLDEGKAFVLRAAVDDTVSIEIRSALDGEVCDCLALDGVSNEGREREVEALLEDEETAQLIEFSGSSVEEYIERCVRDDALDVGEVSIVGGVLYEAGEQSGLECGGANMYAAVGRTTKLRPDARELDDALADDAVCAEMSLGYTSAPSFESHFEKACDHGDDGCCDEAGEARAYWISRGTLVSAAGDVTPMEAFECACRSATPLGEGVCPSVYDPCGSAEGFAVLEDAAHWWVSSEGMYGLALEGDDRFALYARGSDEPVRQGDLEGLSAQDILGVEFHPQMPVIGSLPSAVVLDLPDVDDFEPEESAKFLGNACFERLGEGKLDEAESLCIQALLAGGPDRVRGAVLYTMGRIEEARCNLDRAAEFYSRSLSLRPGNETTQAARDAVRSHPPACP